MNVVIRTDASIQIGSGHVMRCLTLADKLRGTGASVVFVCRETSGNMADYIETKGYTVYRLQMAESADSAPEQLDVRWGEDAEQTREVLASLGVGVDWLVVDHYALDKKWETSIRPYTDRIMVVDDLANRAHDCDLLLDQNYYHDLDTRYDNIVSPLCRKFLGPRYALLRSEFIEAQQNLQGRDGLIRRILIFFGGSDPTNETAKALEAMQLIGRKDIAVDVVAGSANSRKDDIRNLCAFMPNTKFLCQVDNMAELMAGADLALGAGGAATWERCFLGLPTITVVIARNQLETTAALADVGAIWHVGQTDQTSADDYAEWVRRAISNPETVKQVGRTALQIMTSSSGGNNSEIVNQMLSNPGLGVTSSIKLN